MTDQTHHHDNHDRIDAILGDRKALKALLPKVIAKAEATYDPRLQRVLDQHRIVVEEARFYAAGMGTTTIAGLRGKSKQAVDQGVVKLVRRYLLSYPELMEEDDAND